MVDCPKCRGLEVRRVRELRNWYFHIESYICIKCGFRFKTEGGGEGLTKKVN